MRSNGRGFPLSPLYSAFPSKLAFDLASTIKAARISNVVT